MDTPPPIPQRHRQHRRQKSLPPSNSSNRSYVQPASPEVISSLITSLSFISSPANELFETHSTPVSPDATRSTFNPVSNNLNARAHKGYKEAGGSFGIDYGAFERPSLREQPQEEFLDELAASPPVIRTAKPPSGFSQLTAPKSPREPSQLKSFLRGSSRPSSKGSSQSGAKDQDDTNSIGNLSIEPGVAPAPELRRKSSSDSWGKKQGRNNRGLMYMSSKERLREREQEKKRGGGSTKVERLTLPTFDSESFMAETAIGEEPEYSTAKLNSRMADYSPILASPALSSSSQGGIGSGRFIPARDSSLRKPPSTKKRSSQRSSHQSEKQHAGGEGNSTILELDEQKPDRRQDGKRRDQSSESSSNIMGILDSNMEMPPSSKAATPVSRQVGESAKMDHLRVIENMDEGAPSPSVSQRKARPSPDRSHRDSSQKRMSGTQTPEPSDTTAPQPKRTGSRLKRLSAPLSPKSTEKDTHKRHSSTPLSRGASPEPVKLPQIHGDDRPTSADSIDDAVEAYLCSPRLSQKIRHPQTGRTISFSEVGDSEGFAVFCCVGMGLTRYITAFYDELALTLKLRLITPDRPGVGDSEPYNDGTATPLSWPGMLCSLDLNLATNCTQMMSTQSARHSRLPNSPS
jgi:hypothetical protein